MGKPMPMRNAIWTFVAMSLAAVLASTAIAQTYPNRTIKIVVPYPPGASTDAVARTIAQKLSDVFAQPVIVENRAGASGNIGADFVAKSAPDGYTLVLGTDATHATNVHVAKNPLFDPVKDFTSITIAVGNVIALAVHPSFPGHNVAELVEHAKRNPGKLAYGSSGSGSPHHLAGELLRQLTGIDIVHVPYKGGGIAVTDLMGGQIPMMFASLAAVVQQAKVGKVRLIGVVESSRFAGLPDVPTIGETVRGFELASWLGFFGPAGVPAPIVARLNAEIVKALHAPDVRARLEPLGMSIMAMSSDASLAMVKAETDKRGRLIKAAGIQAE
ncbi:MAG: tripartite tricarboxylate transporter substrate binding protein [Betaproteobacteria bacterium]|nr:tripartite tricarboxylate transporter substrate binding protein [Betaproteobacteria bacterium]